MTSGKTHGLLRASIAALVLLSGSLALIVNSEQPVSVGLPAESPAEPARLVPLQPEIAAASAPVVQALAAPGTPGKPRREVGEGVGDDRSGLDRADTQGLRVWGRVLDPGENPAPGMALQWARSQHMLQPLEVSTDSEGAYEIEGLRPGRYFVRVVPRLLRAAWHEAPCRQVTVREGVANRFDWTSEAGSAVSIVVTREDERPAPGVQVRFRLMAAGRTVSGYLPPTSTEGLTTLRGLPAAGAVSFHVPGPRATPTTIDLSNLPAETRLVVRDAAG